MWVCLPYVSVSGELVGDMQISLILWTHTMIMIIVWQLLIVVHMPSLLTPPPIPHVLHLCIWFYHTHIHTHNTLYAIPNAAKSKRYTSCEIQKNYISKPSLGASLHYSICPLCFWEAIILFVISESTAMGREDAMHLFERSYQQWSGEVCTVNDRISWQTRQHNTGKTNNNTLRATNKQPQYNAICTYYNIIRIQHVYIHTYLSFNY